MLNTVGINEDDSDSLDEEIENEHYDEPRSVGRYITHIKHKSVPCQSTDAKCIFCVCAEI